VCVGGDFTALSVSGPVTGLLMDDELESIWKEAVVA
jgi:hypothetical protein